MAGTSKSQSKYNYVPLSSLKVREKVDIYGVVKFLKQPYKSRGSDFCMMVSLVDPSYGNIENDEKLKCLLFGRDEEKLPGTVKLGDIVRFHRLAINSFNDCLQGQSSPGFSWLVFSGDPSDPLEPLRSSSATYSITDIDKQKITDLRRWASNTEGLSETLSTLNDIAAGSYFDMVCQVVFTAVVEEDVCLLLRVWDGTKSIYPIREIVTDLQKQQKDDTLMRRSSGFQHDVCVFDDHFRCARHIKPGDFVKFVNLHAPEFKLSNNHINQTGIPTLELVLHRGNSFGRRVKVISPDNPEIDSLKLKLETVCDIIENDSPQSDSLIVIEEVNSNTERRGSEGLSRVAPPGNGSLIDCAQRSPRKRQRQESNSTTSTPRCMLQTTTVILNHPNTPRSQICDVLDHDVPYKFRVRGQVYDYHPKPDKVRKFLKLYCSACHYLCSLPDTDSNKDSPDSQLQVGSTFKGIAHYNCPKCYENKDSLPELDSPPHLQFIYMLRMILQDDTGMLMVNIWRSDAETFFQSLPPEDLLQNSAMFTKIKDCLHQICPENVAKERKPWIECCLKSSSGAEGPVYQMFDTTIV